MKSRANERRLLILSCSRKKKTTYQSLPALERYDGPSFRVVRKFINECPAEARSLDIRILSAKFGLIRADQPIAWYDRSCCWSWRRTRLQEQLSRILLVSHQEEFARAFSNGYAIALVDGASQISLR